MIIECPICGSRSSIEFSYLGDAALLSRPTYAASPSTWENYVYLRDNPRGLHAELWYHASGCGSWLKVVRNTVSHEIKKVELVRS